MKSHGISALARSLREIVGQRYVLDRPEELLTYECDACTLVKRSPDLVVLPKSTAEVAQVVQLCLRHNVPFTARGSGTGLSGGALPLQGGVQIGLNRMNRILEIDPENLTATVEVGVINAHLNQALKAHDLFYAPDPSSQAACTLGGNIAENAGGIHCIKYGVTTDHILGLEVVLPDGNVTWLGGKTRHSHGPNLVGLMVGSEGTLGIITQAIVKLTPRPAMIRVYLAAFDTPQNAGACVSAIIQSGLTPSALEFMDGFTVKAVNEAFQVGFPENAGAVLLIELDGSPSQISHEEELLQSILTRCGVIQVRVGETEAERLALWKARKGTVAAYGRYQPAFYLNDCVIPRSQLVNLLAKIEAVAQDIDMIICNVFHAGDGNLHPHILFDPDTPGAMEKAFAGGEEILKACLSVGGALSGEHGIGIEKAHFMDLQFSPASLARMKQIKPIFDPANLCNPAKIFPIRTGCGETRQAFSLPMLAQEGLWI